MGTVLERRKARLVLVVAMATIATVTSLAIRGPAAHAGSCVPVGEPQPSPSPSPSDSPLPLPTLLGAGGTSAAAGGQPNNGDGETECPSELTLSLTPATGVYGTRVTFSGRLTCSELMVKQVEVELKVKRADGSLATVAKDLTDDEGDFEFSESPSANTVYVAVWNPKPSDPNDEDWDNIPGIVCRAGKSDAKQVLVRPGVLLNAAKSAPKSGEVVSFGGRVLPVPPGQKVMLQMLSGNQWRNVQTLTLDGSSAYRASYRKTSPGKLLFRTAYPTQSSKHLWNVSRNIAVTWK